MVPEHAAEVASAAEPDLGRNGLHRPSRADQQAPREIKPDPRHELDGRDPEHDLEFPCKGRSAHARFLRQARH